MIQEIFGYVFKDASLLAEALTTPSFKMIRPEVADNQRLEFLGDAVIGLLAAEELYHKYPDVKEGSLTVKRTHMVSSAALSEAATISGLREKLKWNKTAYREIPSNSKTLADAVEALIGAAYLDGGFEAAKKIYYALSLDKRASEGEWVLNPKGELQVLTQALVPPRTPVYELVETGGVAHKPVFKVKVIVEGVGEETASAGNRKEAESYAAHALLGRLKKELQ